MDVFTKCHSTTMKLMMAREEQSASCGDHECLYKSNTNFVEIFPSGSEAVDQTLLLCIIQSLFILFLLIKAAQSGSTYTDHPCTQKYDRSGVSADNSYVTTQIWTHTHTHRESYIA